MNCWSAVMCFNVHSSWDSERLVIWYVSTTSSRVKMYCMILEYECRVKVFPSVKWIEWLEIFFPSIQPGLLAFLFMLILLCAWHCCLPAMHLKEMSRDDSALFQECCYWKKIKWILWLLLCYQVLLKIKLKQCNQK